MEKIQRWLEKVHDRRLKREYDALVPVVGDEGTGKSTFMLEDTWLFQELKGQDPSPESVLDRVVWDDREEFKNELATAPRRSAIAVMDAARVLHRKEAMHGSQIEAEKDLLDVRTNEYLILLGYQGWEYVPTMIANRRAKFAFRIPQRGVVHGFSRAKLDEKKDMDDDEWPDPDLRDSFPPLDGTPLWEEFQEIDRERKNQRMRASDDDDAADDDTDLDDVVEQIKEEGVERVVSIHNGNKLPFIAADLIAHYYDLSQSESKTVKLLLEKDSDITLDEYKPA